MESFRPFGLKDSTVTRACAVGYSVAPHCERSSHLLVPLLYRLVRGFAGQKTAFTGDVRFGVIRSLWRVCREIVLGVVLLPQATQSRL